MKPIIPTSQDQRDSINTNSLHPPQFQLQIYLATTRKPSLIPYVHIDLELQEIWLHSFYIKAREWYLGSAWEGKRERKINAIWDLQRYIWMSHSKHNNSESSTFFYRCSWNSQVFGDQTCQIREKIHKVLESPEACAGGRGRGSVPACLILRNLVQQWGLCRPPGGRRARKNSWAPLL